MNKTIILGKPFTPSAIFDFTVENGFEILYTYGGGMGGASGEMYSTSKPDLNKDFVNITDIYGVEHSFNTKYIVRVTPVKIGKLLIENHGNTYIGNDGDMYCYVYACSTTDEFYVKDAYVDSDKNKDYLVAKYDKEI